MPVPMYRSALFVAEQPSLIPRFRVGRPGLFQEPTIERSFPWLAGGPRRNCLSNPHFVWGWRVLPTDTPSIVAKIVTGDASRWTEIAPASWKVGTVVAIPRTWNAYVDEYGFTSGGVANKFVMCNASILPSPLAATPPPWPYGIVRR